MPDYVCEKADTDQDERYITPESKELEDTYSGSQDRLVESPKYDLAARSGTPLRDNVARIQATARAVAQIDVFVSLALVAGQNNYCKPKINESGVIDIKGGRHPVVEKKNYCQ